MNTEYEKLQKAFESIKDKIPTKPSVGLILGSGLGDYADGLTVTGSIDYSDIEGMPSSTAPGHKGRFVFCNVNGKDIVCMQGRIHYYEGYDVKDVVMPIRLMGLMGIETLILTNATGGISPALSVGDLMIIKDQIAFLLPSPLRGENIKELGVRFPDMSEVYDKSLQALVKKAASNINIPVKEGVYFQTKGPQYESPAEIQAIKAMGGDVVGMSTAIEAIAARHMGISCIGISCVSNLAAGISPTPLTEEEVLETGKKTAAKFASLVTEVIGLL